MIRYDHQLQSVAEREVGDFGAALLGSSKRWRCDRGDERNQRQVCSGKHVIGPGYVAIVRQHEIGWSRPPQSKTEFTAVNTTSPARNELRSSQSPSASPPCRRRKAAPARASGSLAADRSAKTAAVRR